MKSISTEMKCIYYCSTAHLRQLLLAACVFVITDDILKHTVFRLLSLLAIICYSADKVSNIMLDFYSLDSSSTDMIASFLLNIPYMLLFVFIVFHFGLYGYYGGGPEKWNDDGKSLHYFQLMQFHQFYRQVVKSLSLKIQLFSFLILVLAVGSCTTFLPYDDGKRMNDRNQTLSNIVATNWVFVIYLVMISTKNSRRKTETLEAAYKELNELNTTIAREKMLFEKTLNDLLPSNIVYSLTTGQTIEPRYRKNCCVLVLNVEGVGSYHSTSSPMRIFHITNKLFKVIDACVMQFRPVLYKVEGRCDAYIVVGGLCVDEAYDSSSDDETKTAAMVSSLVLFAFLVQDVVRYNYYIYCNSCCWII